MTPAESYKCYDSKSNCAEVAEWRGGCHKHGDSCRKVNRDIQRKSYFLTVPMSRAVDGAKARLHTQATVIAMTKLIIVQRY